MEWISANSDGWLTYPRGLAQQAHLVRQWHETVAEWNPGAFKPFAQLWHIDLAGDPDLAPAPIHGGHRLGRIALLRHLEFLERTGVNHVLFNLKYGSRPADEVMEELAKYIVPLFPAHAVGSTR